MLTVEYGPLLSAVSIAKAARIRSAIRAASMALAPGRIAKLAQDAITGLVPERVVDALELVEIENQQRGRLTGGERLGKQRHAALEECPPIGDAGQGIEQRGGAVFGGLPLLDHAGHQEGHTQIVGQQEGDADRHPGRRRPMHHDRKRQDARKCEA
jgi:hypothetical protein